MKAAVRTRYGPPEVVRVEEVPTPEPGERELLVRVHVTTVNRTDRGYRAGTPFIIRAFSGLVRPKVSVLGTEFAGVVEAVGGGVTRFAPGDRVFGYNERGFGAHAEYMTMPEDGSVATIPDVTFEQAAPSTEGAHYALANLRAADVGAGSEILVYGATGAIGSAAVQLARSLGASVTAVCPGEHLDLVAGLGADRVIDYTTDDFTAEGSYDVVFDAVGKTSFRRCERLLRPGGVFLATDFGPFPWNPLLALTTRFVGRHKVLFPLPEDDRQVVEYLRERLRTGELRPVVDRTYPLDEIVEAYRYVDTGQKVGNVLIAVG
jgi:NADPH:quinone reductase-like Zn-dependent oxidoreductase